MKPLFEMISTTTNVCLRWQQKMEEDQIGTQGVQEFVIMLDGWEMKRSKNSMFKCGDGRCNKITNNNKKNNNNKSKRRSFYELISVIWPLAFLFYFGVCLSDGNGGDPEKNMISEFIFYLLIVEQFTFSYSSLSPPYIVICLFFLFNLFDSVI